MWAKVISKDLTKADVLAKETLRAKWEANPITEIVNTESFLKYVLSVLKPDKQTGMEKINDAFAAMAAAEADVDNKAAATERVGYEHRSNVIDFMVDNNYDLPSAAYLGQRVAQTPGEIEDVEKGMSDRLTQQTTVTQSASDAD